MSNLDSTAPTPQEIIQLLANRILAGEMPPKEEMRAAIAAVRGHRESAIIASATRGSKKSAAPSKDVNKLLSDLGF